MGFRESEPPQERDTAPISGAGEQLSDAAAAIQLAPVVANIPGIVYQRRLSSDGTLSIPFISDGVRDVWGYSPREVMANPSLLIDAIKPSSRAHYEEATVASAETLCLWMVEVEVTAKDGATRWVRGKAQPRRDDDGSVIWDGLIVDITSEKALEAQLNEREGMLAQAKRLTSLGYFAFDIENRKIWWSEETYRLYGASAETFDGSEAALLNRVHMEDRDRVTEARRRCAEAGEPWDMEYRITREDGVERVLHSVCEAELKHGRIVRMAGTVQDVTERAQSEAELKQSETVAREARRLLTDVVESVTDGFAVFDADNKLILFSQAYPDMFPKVAPLIKVGARFHDLIDAARKTGQFLMTPEHQENFTEWRLAKQDAGEPFELQLDTGRWIEVRDRLLPDGTRLSTRVDITEARQAARALRESETRLADAQRIASIGNFERDIATSDVTWSDNQYAIFGVDPATFDHTHQSVFSFVLPEDQPAFIDANSRAIDHGEPWDLHFGIERADGAIRTIRSIGEAVFENGVAASLRGVM